MKDDKNWFENLGYLTLYIIIASGLNLLWAFPFKWAWNHTMVIVFGFPEITWLMAFCIMFLASASIPHRVITKYIKK